MEGASERIEEEEEEDGLFFRRRSCVPVGGDVKKNARQYMPGLVGWLVGREVGLWCVVVVESLVLYS
jgi:hypothetical protein